MTTAELIAALESAPGPSRELDLKIDRWARDNDLPHISRAQLQYTRSVDHAIMLVPGAPWYGEIAWGYDGIQAGGYVELNKPNPKWLEPGYDSDDPPHEHAACVSSYEDQDNGDPVKIEPRPLAIAICIAALRAREPTQD